MSDCCKTCKHRQLDRNDFGRSYRCEYPLPFWIPPPRVTDDDGWGCQTWEKREDET